MKGTIYCLTNRSIPGLVKIGRTRGDPALRAAKIGGATGVPTPFEIAWSVPVRDMDAAEAALHEAVSDRRVNARREFFRCSPSEAQARARRLSAFRPAARREPPMGALMTLGTLALFAAAVGLDLPSATVAAGTALVALGVTAGSVAATMTRGAA